MSVDKLSKKEEKEIADMLLRNNIDPAKITIVSSWFKIFHWENLKKQ